MPDLPKPRRRKYRPKKKAHANNQNQSFYNSTAWRKLSKRIRQNNPVCEIGEALGEVWPSEQVDHIIPMSKGGAPLDPRNLMALSKHYHRIKTGKESHGMDIVSCRGDGGLVPVDRSQVFAYFVDEQTNNNTQ